LVVVAVPAAFAVGLAKRFGDLNNKHNVSTHGHVSRFWTGVDTVTKNPFGLGLGTAAGIGERFGDDRDDSENSYLNVGEEIGVLPMLTFAALIVSLMVHLRRAARRNSELVVAAAWAAGIGLVFASWFLHTWFNFSVTWTYFGIAGAALGVARQRAVVKNERAAPASQQQLLDRPVALEGIASSTAG
jgi:hypothetical protein